MLRYGIPAYRLPPELLEQELDQIRVLGIPIHTSATVGSLNDFRQNRKLGRVPRLTMVVGEHGPETFERGHRHADAELRQVAPKERRDEVVTPPHALGFRSRKIRAGKAAAPP